MKRAKQTPLSKPPAPLNEAIEAEEANMAGVDAKDAMAGRESVREKSGAAECIQTAEGMVAASRAMIMETQDEIAETRDHITRSKTDVAASKDALAGLSQSEKFAQAARDLGTDEGEDAFKGVLRKLAKPKGDLDPS